MTPAPGASARFNMENVEVLLLDNNELGMSILVQIVAGLGVKRIHRCMSEDEAREVVSTSRLDLAIVDALGAEGHGYRFVEWLRREGPEKVRYIPVLLTASHTPAAHVETFARSGGDALVKKPIVPMTLLERILWAARADRQFVVADDYVGPERRSRSGPSPQAKAVNA